MDELSWFASVFLLVNAAVGPGLLELPMAFANSGGALAASLVQAILLVFIVGGIVILGYCSDYHQDRTYQDVVYSICGKTVKMASSLFVALYCYSYCLMTLITIGDQWDKFFSFVIGPRFCNMWYTDRRLMISFTSVIFILPMSYSRKIGFLTPTSVLGVLAITYCVILVVVKYFSPNQPQDWTAGPTDDILVALYAVPAIAGCYQCHDVVVPVYASFQKRDMKQFTLFLTVAMVMMITSYTSVAVLGYWTFGASVSSDILVSYQPDPEVVVAVVMVALKMYTLYPILNYSGRLAAESIWVDLRGYDPKEAEATEQTRRVVMTTVAFVIILLLSLVTPNIAAAVPVAGAFSAMLMFFFPGMILGKLTLPDDSSWRTGWTYTRCGMFVTAVAFVGLGIFTFGFSLVQLVMIFLENGSIRTDIDTCMID